MRLLLLLAVVLTLAPGLAHAQYNDEEQGLFDEEPVTINPDEDQIDIPLGDDSSGLKDVETEEVTEQTLCCQMPESERASDDLCTNIVCP